MNPARRDLPEGIDLPDVSVCVTELTQIIGNMARRLQRIAEYDYDLVPAHIVLGTIAERIAEHRGETLRFKTESEIEEWFYKHPISIEQVIELLIGIVFALSIRERVGGASAPGKRQRIVDLWRRPGAGAESILQMIKEGEGKTLEFKETLRTNAHTGSVDSSIELEVIRAIAGFLNTDGGTVLVGVADDGSLRGYDSRLFRSEDQVKRYIGDKIRSCIRGTMDQLVETSVETVQDKEIVRIDCRPSRTPAYLRIKGEGALFIRVDAATRKLDISDVKAYIDEKFGR